MRSRNRQGPVEHYEAGTIHRNDEAEGQLRAVHGLVTKDQASFPGTSSSTVADIDAAPFNTWPVGTGPFKFKNRVAGGYIEFEPNAKCRRRSAEADIVRLRDTFPINVPSTRSSRAGEVDIYDLGACPLLYRRAKALPGSKTPVERKSGCRVRLLRCGKPQFTDERVRKAIYMAVDKKAGLTRSTMGIRFPRSFSAARSLRPTTRNWSILDSIRQRLRRCWTRPVQRRRSGVRAKDRVRLAFSMSTTAGNGGVNRPNSSFGESQEGRRGDDGRRHAGLGRLADYAVEGRVDTQMVGWDALLYADPDYGDRIDSKANRPGRRRLGLRAVQSRRSTTSAPRRQRGQAETDRKAIEVAFARGVSCWSGMPFAPIWPTRGSSA